MYTYHLLRDQHVPSIYNVLPISSMNFSETGNTVSGISNTARTNTFGSNQDVHKPAE
jgi:hypothetical protein